MRGTSWAPPHLAFPLSLLCPELGLGKILCAKRRRRGGNGQVKKNRTLVSSERAKAVEV